jgi:hypothetical protein
MQTPEVVNDSPVMPEPSFADLRKMTRAESVESTEVEDPASDAGDGEANRDSDSGTESNQERGADGKFVKPKATQEDEESDEGYSEAVRKRINRERYKRGELEREIAELKGKLASNTQETVTPAQKQETAPATNDDPRPTKPKLADYDSYEKYDDDHDKYVEALSDWKIRDSKRKDAAESENRQRAEAVKTAHKTWEERETAFAEKHGDYLDKLKTLEFEQTPAVPAVRQALLESEIGPEVLYYLATHQDEAKEILQLSPASAIRRVGKLEAKLTPSSTPETATKRTTEAPKPPARVADGSGPAPKALKASDLEKMPMKDFKKAVPKLLGR